MFQSRRSGRSARLGYGYLGREHTGDGGLRNGNVHNSLVPTVTEKVKNRQNPNRFAQYPHFPQCPKRSYFRSVVDSYAGGFETEGPHVGDVMGLIYNCKLCRTNPFNYLTELESHADDVASDSRR